MYVMFKNYQTLIKWSFFSHMYNLMLRNLNDRFSIKWLIHYKNINVI